MCVCVCVHVCVGRGGVCVCVGECVCVCVCKCMHLFVIFFSAHFFPSSFILPHMSSCILLLSVLCILYHRYPFLSAHLTSYHLFSLFLISSTILSCSLFTSSTHSIICAAFSSHLILSLTLCYHLCHHFSYLISSPHVSSLLFCQQGTIPVSSPQTKPTLADSSTTSKCVHAKIFSLVNFYFSLSLLVIFDPLILVSWHVCFFYFV
jgi:hypothetical protein